MAKSTKQKTSESLSENETKSDGVKLSELSSADVIISTESQESETASDGETITVDVPEVQPKLPAASPPSITHISETEFLRRIYAIQNDGGFGTHLNKEILDRIELLNNK